MTGTPILKDFSVVLLTCEEDFKVKIAEKLDKFGYKAKIISSAFELLNYIDNNIVHLLLVDRKNDDMPVLEVLTLVRSYFTKEQLPIIFFMDHVVNSPSLNELATISNRALNGSEIIDTIDHLQLVLKKVK